MGHGLWIFLPRRGGDVPAAQLCVQPWMRPQSAKHSFGEGVPPTGNTMASPGGRGMPMQLGASSERWNKKEFLRYQRTHTRYHGTLGSCPPPLQPSAAPVLFLSVVQSSPHPQKIKCQTSVFITGYKFDCYCKIFVGRLIDVIKPVQIIPSWLPIRC